MREYSNHNTVSDFVRLLRRAALAVVLIGAPFAAVAKSGNEPAPVVSGSALLGWQPNKPNGVGFVLAVGLQRARG